MCNSSTGQVRRKIGGWGGKLETKTRKRKKSVEYRVGHEVGGVGRKVGHEDHWLEGKTGREVDQKNNCR